MNNPVIIEKSQQNLQYCAEQVNQTFRAVQRNEKKALGNAVECGHHLIAAKEQCKHGQFQKWLDDHCELKPRQAQRYMRLAKHWDTHPKLQEAKASATTHLTIDSALELIADPSSMVATVATTNSIDTSNNVSPQKQSQFAFIKQKLSQMGITIDRESGMTLPVEMDYKSYKRVDDVFQGDTAFLVELKGDLPTPGAVKDAQRCRIDGGAWKDPMFYDMFDVMSVFNENLRRYADSHRATVIKYEMPGHEKEDRLKHKIFYENQPAKVAFFNRKRRTHGEQVYQIRKDWADGIRGDFSDYVDRACFVIPFKSSMELFETFKKYNSGVEDTRFCEFYRLYLLACERVWHCELADEEFEADESWHCLAVSKEEREENNEVVG